MNGSVIVMPFPWGDAAGDSRNRPHLSSVGDEAWTTWPPTRHWEPAIHTVASFCPREPREAPASTRDAVFYAPESMWHQSEVGGAFDIGPLSVIGDLDPTGANGVLREVLGMFGTSLEPFIGLLEQHRERGCSTGVKFEAHKLSSAAAQMGAMRLATACKAISRHFDSGEFRTAPARLDTLVDDVLTETVRVQRKLRQLLS